MNHPSLIPQHLSQLVGKITKDVTKKIGINFAELYLSWAVIVGETIAKKCSLDHVQFPNEKQHEGTLYVKVHPSFVIDCEYLKPFILEKINSHLGYKAFHHLKIQQSFFDKSKKFGKK